MVLDGLGTERWLVLNLTRVGVKQCWTGVRLNRSLEDLKGLNLLRRIKRITTVYV